MNNKNSSPGFIFSYRYYPLAVLRVVLPGPVEARSYTANELLMARTSMKVVGPCMTRPGHSLDSMHISK